MTSEVQKEKVSKEPSWLSGLLDMPWLALVINIARLGIRVLRGLSSEGVYEVLEYETTLELRDTKGKIATFKKHERVRYLQDHIIAYQDQGWGDGKILGNYQCTPGVPVDRYRYNWWSIPDLDFQHAIQVEVDVTKRRSSKMNNFYDHPLWTGQQVTPPSSTHLQPYATPELHYGKYGHSGRFNPHIWEYNRVLTAIYKAWK